MRVAIIMMGMLALCRAQDDHSVVRFTNGDRISGKLLSLTPDRLVWKSEILREPAEFEIQHVLDLVVPEAFGIEDERGAEHEAVLEMKNGDVIKGMLAALTDDEIVLDTLFAGRLPVRRVNVSKVTINRTSEILYRGPKSLEEWHVEEGDTSWKFKGGALQTSSAGAISREIDFTDECKISFDAAWRGGFRPRIIMFSEDHKAVTPQGGYEMVFQANTMHLKRAGVNNTWLGHSTNAGVLRENEKARFEIRASLKTGKILFYVNGELIDLFEDADVKSLKYGKGFHIITQDNTLIRISNLVVSEWDGYVDEVPKRQNDFRMQRFEGRLNMDLMDQEAAKKEEEEVVEGAMKLVNGDSIVGEVLGIEGETIRVKTELAEMSFPVHRLKNMALKGLNTETPKRNKGDVRATLLDGSKMVFRMDAVQDGKILGFSQHFGKAEFAEGAFQRIEFNIYKSNLEDERRKDDW